MKHKKLYITATICALLVFIGFTALMEHLGMSKSYITEFWISIVFCGAGCGVAVVTLFGVIRLICMLIGAIRNKGKKFFSSKGAYSIDHLHPKRPLYEEDDRRHPSTVITYPPR